VSAVILVTDWRADRQVESEEEEGEREGEGEESLVGSDSLNSTQVLIYHSVGN
jgi:hypothetical protein